MSHISFFSPLYLDQPSSVFGRLYNGAEALFDFGRGPSYVVDCSSFGSSSVHLTKYPKSDVSFFSTLIKIVAIATLVVPVIALLLKATIHHYSFQVVRDHLGKFNFDPKTVSVTCRYSSALEQACMTVQSNRQSTPVKGEGSGATDETWAKVQVQILREELFNALEFMVANGGRIDFFAGIFGFNRSQLTAYPEFIGENLNIQDDIGPLTLLLMIYLDSKDFYDNTTFDLEEFKRYVTLNFSAYKEVTNEQWNTVIKFLGTKRIINVKEDSGLPSLVTRKKTLEHFKTAAQRMKEPVSELEKSVALQAARVSYIRSQYKTEQRTQLFDSLMALAKAGGSFKFLEGNFELHALSLQAHQEMGWVTEDHTKMFNAIAIFALLYLDIHSDPIGSVSGAKLSAYEQICDFNLSEFRNYLCRFAKVFQGISEKQMFQLFNFIGPILKNKGYLQSIEVSEHDYCYKVQLADFERIIEFFKGVTKVIDEQLIVARKKKVIIGKPGGDTPLMLRWASGVNNSRIKAIAF